MSRRASRLLVAAVIAVGFTSVLVARSGVVSTLSLTYAGAFLGLLGVAHIALRVALPDAEPSSETGSEQRRDASSSAPTLRGPVWSSVPNSAANCTRSISRPVSRSTSLSMNRSPICGRVSVSPRVTTQRAT